MRALRMGADRARMELALPGPRRRSSRNVGRGFGCAPLVFDCEFATPGTSILLNGTPIRCCTKGGCCNVATVCRPAARIVVFVKIFTRFQRRYQLTQVNEAYHASF